MQEKIALGENSSNNVEPYTTKDVYLCFSSIIWLLQFLSHLLLFIEARDKFVSFYTKV